MIEKDYDFCDIASDILYSDEFGVIEVVSEVVSGNNSNEGWDDEVDNDKKGEDSDGIFDKNLESNDDKDDKNVNDNNSAPRCISPFTIQYEGCKRSRNRKGTPTLREFYRVPPSFFNNDISIVSVDNDDINNDINNDINIDNLLDIGSSFDFFLPPDHSNLEAASDFSESTRNFSEDTSDFSYLNLEEFERDSPSPVVLHTEESEICNEEKDNNKNNNFSDDVEENDEDNKHNNYAEQNNEDCNVTPFVRNQNNEHNNVTPPPEQLNEHNDVTHFTSVSECCFSYLEGNDSFLCTWDGNRNNEFFSVNKDKGWDKEGNKHTDWKN